MPQRKNRNVSWAPAAEKDLYRLWHYLEGIASEDIANALYLNTQRAITRLRDRPFIERPRDDVFDGLRSMLVHPYAMYYRVHDDGSIEIIRILHQRRDIRKALRER